MHKPIRLTFAAALAASMVAGTTGAATAAPACEWKGTELDAIPGTKSARAVEANGDVIVGETGPDGNQGMRIVTWDKNGKVTKDYGEFGVVGPTHFTGVTSDGTFVGYQVQPTHGSHSFISHNGELTELSGNRFTFARGINEKGVVVGDISSKPVTWQADQPGKHKELTGLPKGTKPVDIDDDGSILLEGDNEDGVKDYVWRDGKATELKFPAGLEGSPSEISNGHIIGNVTSNNGGGTSQGIYWDQKGEPTVVKSASELNGVSDDGVFVGYDRAVERSGVWKQGKHMSWLGKTTEQAEALEISPEGMIVGGSESEKAAMAWRCG